MFPLVILRRYVTAEQKKTEEFAITEDDVSEIRQDINKFRYEMIEILRSNNFNTPEVVFLLTLRQTPRDPRSQCRLTRKEWHLT